MVAGFVDAPQPKIRKATSPLGHVPFIAVYLANGGVTRE